MSFQEKFIIGSSCLRAILFNKKIPVFISWSITERCNLQCKFCHAWCRQSLELPTPRVWEIINTLSKMGTKMIKFTGGEPLMRDDITKIINYTHDLGIYTTLSTNGILFPEKVEEMNKLDRVSISLEGPEDIHNSIRGHGSYKKAIKAIETAKIKNIQVTISTTLNALDLTSIEYLLKLAEKFNAKIIFQPAIQICLYGEESNPIVPDVNQYRRVILNLIKLKKTNKFIGNSIAGLRHFFYWPDRTDINCVAGKIICRLDSQGRMKPCGRFDVENNTLDVIEKGIEDCFNQLRSPKCGNCWCSSFVELNLISEFNINAIVNAIGM